MPTFTLEKGLFWSALLIGAGLLVEFSLFWSERPLAFIAFLAIACPLVLAGMLLFLWTLVVSDRDVAAQPRRWNPVRYFACRPPGRRAFFPLIVGELAGTAAVNVDDEQLAVRLRRVGVDPLVLESHPRRRDDDVLAVG